MNNQNKGNGRIEIKNNSRSSGSRSNYVAKNDDYSSNNHMEAGHDAGKTNGGNNKGKRKLTAIIIASSLAFILTVVLTATITLAFFGGGATGTGDITMGGPVNVNDSVIDTINIAGALPGQKVNLNAQATVSSTATNPTNAILRAYFTWSVSDGADIASPTIPTDAIDVNGTGDAKWVKNGDFYYLTNADDSNMAVIDLTATGNTKTVALVDSYTLSNALTNEVADKTITINVEFTALQANLPVGADGALTDVVSMEQARTLFNDLSTNDDTSAIA